MSRRIAPLNNNSVTHHADVDVVQKLPLSVSCQAFQRSKMGPGTGITNPIQNWNRRGIGFALPPPVSCSTKPELRLVPKPGLGSLGSGCRYSDELSEFLGSSLRREIETLDDDLHLLLVLRRLPSEQPQIEVDGHGLLGDVAVGFRRIVDPLG